MMMQTKQQPKATGAALILVVVVTVLLAVIGVMFLMVSRVSEMETSAIADQHDLDAAVRTVTGRINEVLVTDLFGLRRPVLNAEFDYDGAMVNADLTAVGTDPLNIHADEPYDYPSHRAGAGVAGVIGPGPGGMFNEAANNNDIWLPGQYDDYWLASLEPVFNAGTLPTPLDDYYEWPHITDLWGTLQGTDDSLFFQRYNFSDHNKFFKKNPTRKRWIDPDITADRTTWDAAGEWDRWQVSAYNVRAKVITTEDRMDVAAVIGATVPTAWENAASETDVRFYGARADADGDGVADSRWVPVPGMTTSRGKPVYAAVRIIDNCAMLNLNAAHAFYQEDTYDPTAADRVSSFATPWNYFVFNGTQWERALYYDKQKGNGRYVTEINYYPFLRGHDLNGDSFFNSAETGDYWLNLMTAKGMTFTGSLAGVGSREMPLWPEDAQRLFFTLDDPTRSSLFFDISDELEIRNRFLLTSGVQSRFEQTTVANYTLDSGGGGYAALKVPRDYTNDFGSWTRRMDPINFDEFNAVTTDPYEYDRRHVSTFYSYDRTIRHGQYPQLTADAMAVLGAPAFTIPVGYTRSRYEEAFWKVFTPKGPVTTDLEDPTAPQPWNNVQTRKRILHLLYALRDHYMETEGLSKQEAALKSAQIVANIIDYSDDDSANDDNASNADGQTDTQGPFYRPIFNVSGKNINYGQQANNDCTFLTKAIIDMMLIEVSNAVLGSGNEIDVSTAKYAALDFGLDATEIVFGYERQPFISEIYAQWDGAQPIDSALLGFAIELVNPYSDKILIDGWRLRVGDGSRVDHEVPISAAPTWFVPEYDTTANTPGRIVFESDASVFAEPGGMLAYPAIAELSSLDSAWTAGEDLQIQLLRPAPANSGQSYIVVDEVSNEEVRSVLGSSGLAAGPGNNALKRDDRDWKFAQADYELQRDADGNYTDTLGIDNDADLPGSGFQMAVADDGYPLSRWHDLEVLSLFGNRADTASGDPNDAITGRISTAVDNGEVLHFDLEADASVLDYLCTMNRPEVGTLPGRININTAPVHVIAAAIPPTLADPNAADPNVLAVPAFSALDLARAIVVRRNTVGPYEKLGDLLNIPEFRQYVNGKTWADPDAGNVGAQSIEDDIEERHWVLSNLANKFTVRSDVFTAYILVRLGENGPQRRMIAIFDRSQVWTPDDRPVLVALHPVPDPR